MRHRLGQALWFLAVLGVLGGCSKSSDKPEGGGAPAAADRATAPAGGEAAKAPAAGPARTSMDCAAYIAKSNDAMKSAKLTMVIEAGSWAGTPAPLQELPAGASLCGGYRMETIATIVIQSPLFGSELKAAYDPIMKKAGCTFGKDTSTGSATHLSWDCPKDKGGPVNMLTVPDVQFYTMASMTP